MQTYIPSSLLLPPSHGKWKALLSCYERSVPPLMLWISCHCIFSRTSPYKWSLLSISKYSTLYVIVCITGVCCNKTLFKKTSSGTSLVAQWLGILLPMQETRVWALGREDPTFHGATKPVHHNYWACALEPASHNYCAHVPQLLKPVHLEPVPCTERPLQWEAHAPQRRVAPICYN